MRQLTLNDFIYYNNPCFGCGKPISIRLESETPDKFISDHIIPFVTKDFLDADLKIKYKETLKIKIYLKTNKFICTNLTSLTKYLQKYTLTLEAFCTNCKSFVKTEKITFNLDKGYLLPITLNSETTLVVDSKKRRKYYLYSYYRHNKSTIIIDDYSDRQSVKSSEIEIPLLTLFTLKSKDKFLEKIKTIMIFS